MKKPLLYIPAEKLDKSKYIRQLREIVRWKNAGARGTIIAPTGCGKTIIASIAIAKMVRWYPDYKAVVVVPGIDLKTQWEGIMKHFGLADNVEVIVINSLLLRDKITCNLLVCDEYHRYPSEKFSMLFDIVEYSWLLGLTATIKRLDGLESLLLARAPICGEITVKEALRNGWISEMLHINLPVPLTRKETEALKELDKQISRGLSVFGGDFKLMQRCQNIESAKAYVAQRYPQEDEDIKGKIVQVDAINTSKRIHKRKEAVNLTKHKIEASVKLIQELRLKTIIFSESTTFATLVAEELGPIAVDYHSNVAPKEIEVEVTKTCKTQASILKLIDTLDSYKSVPTVIGKKTQWDITYKVKKMLSSAKVKEANMKAFMDNEVEVLSTARAVDVGFDKDDLEFGLEASRTSADAQVKQRRGRVFRTFTYPNGTKKLGLYVSLYVPNSQDEKWLRRSQAEIEDSVIWMDDIDETIDLIKATLKAQRTKTTLF